MLTERGCRGRLRRQTVSVHRYDSDHVTTGSMWLLGYRRGGVFCCLQTSLVAGFHSPSLNSLSLLLSMRRGNHDCLGRCSLTRPCLYLWMCLSLSKPFTICQKSPCLFRRLCSLPPPFVPLDFVQHQYPASRASAQSTHCLKIGYPQAGQRVSTAPRRFRNIQRVSHVLHSKVLSPNEPLRTAP